MRHRTCSFWAIPLFTLLLSALWTAPVRAEPPAAPHFVNSYDLIEAVNSLRAQNGLTGYSINSILMNVAQAHSDYQAAIGAVTHYGAGGTRPFQRALEAGYPVAGDLSLGGFYSENIMGGTGLTAHSVVDAWTGDALHLGTMLSTNLTEVGAGVACNGNFCYFTLDAAQPSGSPVSYAPAVGVTAGATLSGAGATGVVVLPNTPKSDGSVTHVVRPGEALWSLAIAYGTTTANLIAINNLTSDLIFPGDTLIIFLPHATLTAAPTETGTPVPAAPSFVFRTATSPPEPTATPIPAAPVASGSGAIVVGIIIVAALVVAGVLTAASSARRRVK